jgi:excisionase family DNA binding protein
VEDLESPESPERLLITEEVADLFRVSESTVRSWVRSGKVPAVRLSDRWMRFRLEDVQDILKRGVPS